MIRFVLNIVFLISMSCLSLIGQTKEIQSFASIDAVEFYYRQIQYDNSVLIDARTKKEYRKEHLPNSVLADSKKVLLTIADTLDHEQPIFVYCDEGIRSFTACIVLADIGFNNIFNLENGYAEWKREGFPVVKP